MESFLPVLLAWALILTFIKYYFVVHKVAVLDQYETLPMLSKNDLMELFDSSSLIFCSPSKLWELAPLYFYLGLVILWFNLWDLLFHWLLLGLLALFFPYLQRPSRYYAFCSGKIFYRSWKHLVMYSSLIYLSGCVAAVCAGYMSMAFVCLLTAMGSLLYHRHREGQFFNFDNIFATSKLILFIYTAIHAVDVYPAYAWAALLGAPWTLFVFVYCGDPADVLSLPTSSGELHCIRSERSIYDTWHSVWHVLSGLGPVTCALYLHHFPLDRSHLLLQQLAAGQISAEQMLLTCSLLLAVGVNVLLNVLGVAPLA
jgi:hypothetical protein